MDSQEFIKEFIKEALPHGEQIEAELLALSKESDDIDRINRIFRSIHSIKGSAGFFGLKNIVQLAHTMETFFGLVRNGKLRIKNSMLDPLLQANDCLKEMLLDIENAETIEITPHIKNINKLIQIQEVSKSDLEYAKEHGHTLYKIQCKVSEDLKKRYGSPERFLKEIKRIGKIIGENREDSSLENLKDWSSISGPIMFLFASALEKKLLAQALQIPVAWIRNIEKNISEEEFSKILHLDEGDNKNYDEIQTKRLEKEDKKPTLSESIRVDVNMLNDLLNLTSEMVLGRNQLLAQMAPYRKGIYGIDRTLQNINRLTSELQEKVMQVRMQPLSNIFKKFPRMIRELGKETGKVIELHIEGEQVELDKSLIERLGDPLIHLIRNAVAHGLELPLEREKLNKTKVGNIYLKARHDAGMVYIDVTDDGAGIDFDKIKNKIIERNLLKKQQVQALTQQELLLFLFHPGFSTAASITDLSGRGVGMDVVKSNVEKLGGSIDISTKRGKGTTFHLVFPLTLAIILSVIVKTKGHRFALPQRSLKEVIRIRPDEISKRIKYINDNPILKLREKFFPLVDLAQILKLGKTEFSEEKILRILLLELDGKSFGLLVDEIQEEEEILVKPLPRYLKTNRCYSGVTILGEGDTTMILEPEGIVQKANLKFMEENIQKENEKNNQESIKECRLVSSLLLFKCAGPEILGMDFENVAKIERIQEKDIEHIGKYEYVKWKERLVRLIHPERYLPIQSSKVKREKYYIIILKDKESSSALIADQIDEHMEIVLEMNQKDIMSRGLKGSTIINDRIVLLVDAEEIIKMAEEE